MRSSALLHLAALVPAALVAGTSIRHCKDLDIHTIVSGDTLNALAATAKTDVDVLKSLNIALPSFDSLSIGQHILIPNSECHINFCNVVTNYTIKAGDTLSALATANNSTVAAILFVNSQITNANFIRAGDSIRIPAPTCSFIHATVPATANCVDPSTNPQVSPTYTVMAGDTMFVIATQKLFITLASFIAANLQVADPAQIQIGQVLNVPICGTCVPASNPTYGGGSYTAIAQDTFTIIANDKLNITLNAFEAANTQVTNYNVINIGEVLNVPICKS